MVKSASVASMETKGCLTALSAKDLTLSELSSKF